VNVHLGQVPLPAHARTTVLTAGWVPSGSYGETVWVPTGEPIAAERLMYGGDL
jgi:hypothetical protein